MSNTYVIPKQQQTILYNHPDKYPAGTINPTERKVITKNLCIDTLFRKNYERTTSTNFLHTLPAPISNVISMKVSAIEFPNAWYTFAAENQSNEFTITVFNAPTPEIMRLDDPTFAYAAEIKHTIIIPEGNYRSDLLRDAMNNLLTNAQYGLEYIQFDINELNTRSIFRTKTSGDNNTDPSVQNDTVYTESQGQFYFTIDFRIESNTARALYKNAGWMLGFRAPFYEVPFSQSGKVVTIETGGMQLYNWYIESESSYGSSIQNYVFLEIDDFNKNFSTNTLFANTTNETYLGNNIMGRISVTTGMNTIITNTASDCVFKKREYFGPIKLEKLHVRLINRYGDPILFNGNDFSFVLEIEQLYSQ